MHFQAHIPDAEALFAEILASCTNPDSQLHGPTHWGHVGKAGHTLLRAHPEADPVVVFLFALFHDCNRLNDDDDPGHGARGAILALNFWRRSADDRLFKISKAQMLKLYEACQTHTEAYITRDPTLAVCFDADRLNLARVGITPDPDFLSMEEARRPTMIARMSDEVWDEPPSWAELARRYSEL